jgi:hypothetical protein
MTISETYVKSGFSFIKVEHSCAEHCCSILKFSGIKNPYKIRTMIYFTYHYPWYQIQISHQQDRVNRQAFF